MTLLITGRIPPGICNTFPKPFKTPIAKPVCGDYYVKATFFEERQNNFSKLTFLLIFL
jgi:hypothetical protein